MLRRAWSHVRWSLFAEDASAGGTWRAFLIGLGLLAGVAAANTACQQRHWYDRFEWADLDRLHLTGWASAPERVPALVMISNADYETIFQSTSPLNPAGVVQLVGSVCRFGPSVVGVDLLTGDWTADGRGAAVAALSSGCRVVWIHDVEESGAGALRLGAVLGADAAPLTMCGTVPLIDPDADGVVRHYTTHYPLQPADGREITMRYPTLWWSLAGQPSGDDRCVERATPFLVDDPRRKIRFSANGRFVRLNANHVLDAASDDRGVLAHTVRRLLQDRVVLIGGGYRHARDRHPTPVGQLFGVEIAANAVVSEALPIGDVSGRASFIMSVLVGVPLLAVLTWARLRWGWALIASSMLTVAAAFLICWWAFNYMGYFASVFGSVAGVMLAVVVELCRRPLRAHYEELRVRLRSSAPEPHEPEQAGELS